MGGRRCSQDTTSKKQKNHELRMVMARRLHNNITRSGAVGGKEIAPSPQKEKNRGMGAGKRGKKKHSKRRLTLVRGKRTTKTL